MYGDIEDLVLSGKLFAPPSRSSSPVRPRSPSSPSSPTAEAWHPEADDFAYDSDAERRAELEAHLASQQPRESMSIGMGPGRTGVKGVIRDRREAEAAARARRAEEVREMNRAMEKASLGGKTWAEEERERRAAEARAEGAGTGTGKGTGKGARNGRYGHLREVGVRSYVQAVEEDRSVWVVVHIYDPSLDRCANVDDALTRLARTYPHTKFLRVRAGAIGFASSQGGSKPSLINASSSKSYSRGPSLGAAPKRSRIQEKDEDGLFDDDDEEEDEKASDGDEDDKDDEQWEDDAVDTDVLPTILVYRGGDLVHSWVRVDWEAKQGIEDLLKRHNILTSPRHFGGTSGNINLSDDEFSDDGEELVFGNSDDER
uniref:N/A n=1 Tax=Ganoderma boninense TaxID=34458 RepID=A0A5K1JZW5_9APHY|nr:N/A [Ganoderma boninense]